MEYFSLVNNRQHKTHRMKCLQTLAKAAEVKVADADYAGVAGDTVAQATWGSSATEQKGVETHFDLNAHVMTEDPCCSKVTQEMPMKTC